MEQNLQNALKDVPTLTELAVLALYGIFVTEPYITRIRGSGLTELNALDLGPFHTDLMNHIQKLINNPDLLLSSATADEAEFLKCKTWRKSRAVTAIHSMTINLPHIRPLLIAFLTGALDTWIRFCEEYTEGGTVDGMTVSERESAWMPSTNDVNEGTLGKVVRINRRNKPTQTMHQNVSQAIFTHNNTQDFMNEEFVPEDDKFVMQEARRLDKSGLEKQRLAELREHDEHVVATKRQKDAERERTAAAKAAKVAAATLIKTRSELDGLTCDGLNEQLSILRQWDDTIRAKSFYKTKQEKFDAVRAALDRYDARGLDEGRENSR